MGSPNEKINENQKDPRFVTQPGHKKESAKEGIEPTTLSHKTTMLTVTIEIVVKDKISTTATLHHGTI